MTWSNNIKVDAIGLAAEVVDLRRELEQQATLLGKGSEREARLLAENAELRAKINDPARLHAYCVRHLTDAQVAHLFGERMTEIVNSRDRLEAENAALRADRARLDWLTNSLGWIVVGEPEADPSQHATEDGTLADAWRAAIDAARKEAQP